MVDDNMPADQSEVDIHSTLNENENAGHLLQEAFDLWINPEIEKRRATGSLPVGFQLVAAQHIQRPDGENITRLNDEVRGMMKVGPIPGAKIGDEVYYDQLKRIECFDLDDEDLDSGHLTVIRVDSSWFISFNFLNQRARCRNLLEKSRQFLEAAKRAVELNYPAVAVDNLFSACELISKAELVSSHVLAMEVRTHSAIARSLNHWRKMGNIESAFVDIFNQLGQLRPRYRYDTVFSDPAPVTNDSLELVGEMIELVLAKVSPLRPEGRRVPECDTADSSTIL